MITDTIYILIILSFIVGGIKRPYIALAGVIWIDFLKPQQLSYYILANQPLSMLMTGFFIFSFIINHAEIKFPKSKGTIVCIILLMIWITITTFKAHYPILAKFKFDVAIKTLFFSAFIPFVIDSRKKIECILWILHTSISFYITIAGAKSLLGGGGYQMSVIQTTAINSGITETSTLSAVTVSLVPLTIYLYFYSLASINHRFIKLYLIAQFFASIFAVFGTYARTGLVTSIFLALFMFYTSKKKIRLFSLYIIFCLLAVPLLPNDWIGRMETVKHANEESSALRRLIVWRWTLDYSIQNPIFGGGFYAFNDNRNKLSYYIDDSLENLDYNPERAIAFHSIIFELLGEQGYVGLIIYMLFIFLSINSFRQFIKVKDVNLAWKSYLSKMVLTSTFVYLIGGLFVSIAFEPFLFNLLCIGNSISNIPKMID